MSAPFIMLVDDEVDYVKVLAERLNNRNVKTITAFSGAEGLEKLKTNQALDVIILDVRMPGMDGHETLSEIKKTAPLTEVILLTGHATMESAIDGMKQGAFDYLMKPFDIDQLVAKVTEAAQKKQAHEEKIKTAREARIKEILSLYE